MDYRIFDVLVELVGSVHILLIAEAYVRHVDQHCGQVVFGDEFLVLTKVKHLEDVMV